MRFGTTFSSPKEYVTENHRLIAETFVLISYLCLVGAAISVARYKFGLDTAYTSLHGSKPMLDFNPCMVLRLL